jgi:cell division septation protein DedD
VRIASLRPNADEPSDTPAREHMWTVQLAAVRSTDSANREWERIRRQHDEVVGTLRLSVERADLGPDRGVYYRVRAGAFADKASAAAVCKAMTRRNAGCMVVSGN